MCFWYKTEQLRQDTTKRITRHDRIIQVNVGQTHIDERRNKTENMKFSKRKKGEVEQWKGKMKYKLYIYIFIYMLYVLTTTWGVC